jgi:hypothetical protein
MQYEEKKSIEKVGLISGFIASYFLFTTILFTILFFLGKFNGLKYYQVMAITFLISIVGLSIKRYLK